MVLVETEADRIAVHALIGCETPDCTWEGVVEVQYRPWARPSSPVYRTFRACRAHAAPYRSDGMKEPGINPADYIVIDYYDRPNRRLVYIHHWANK